MHPQLAAQLIQSRFPAITLIAFEAISTASGDPCVFLQVEGADRRLVEAGLATSAQIPIGRARRLDADDDGWRVDRLTGGRLRLSYWLGGGQMTPAALADFAPGAWLRRPGIRLAPSVVNDCGIA